MPMSPEQVRQYWGDEEYGGLETPPEQKLLNALASVGSGYGIGQLGAGALEAFSGSAPRYLASEAGEIRSPFGKGYPYGKNFDQQQYPFTQNVKVQYPNDMTPFYDQVKGLNRGHALARGRWNWEGASVKPTGFSDVALPKAESIMDQMSKLQKEYDALKESL